MDNTSLLNAIYCSLILVTCMLYRLILKPDHGHCHIPRHSPEFKQLLNWLMKNKRCRDKPCGTNKQLTQNQIEKLVSIGALKLDEDSPGNSQSKKEPQHHDRLTWDEQCDALQAFRRQFGHCQVPSDDAKWTSLAQWLGNQKESYHDKRLSMYQLRKLEAVGVVQIHHPPSTRKYNQNKPPHDVASIVPSTTVALPTSMDNDDDDGGAAATRRTKRIRADKSCSDGDWFACRIHIVLADWTTREIGFIFLSSRSTSTFADARQKILDTLILDPVEFDFHLPLGPMSEQQESLVGPMFDFLNHYDPTNSISKKADAQLFLVKRAKRND